MDRQSAWSKGLEDETDMNGGLPPKSLALTEQCCSRKKLELVLKINLMPVLLVLLSTLMCGCR